MDLSDPTRSITPTLDGTVLAVLAASGQPMTVGQVAEQAARGSEIGIRRSLSRLVEQGTVRATLMGRNQVHELNREHIAARVAVALADLRPDLWERFRKELRTWRVSPLYGCVFGSAARGDGSVDSDIDLLLVHPPFPGERVSRTSAGVLAQLSDRAGSAVLASADHDAADQWEDQLARLHDQVRQWTGNPLQIVDLTFSDWRHPGKEHRPLLEEVEREGVDLVIAPGLRVWRRTRASDG